MQQESRHRRKVCEPHVDPIVLEIDDRHRQQAKEQHGVGGEDRPVIRQPVRQTKGAVAEAGTDSSDEKRIQQHQHEQRGDDLDDYIVRSDGDATVATTPAKQNEADDGNVVVPGDPAPSRRSERPERSIKRSIARKAIDDGV